MRRARRQRGFTLTELAFGGLIAAGLSVVALELLLANASVKMELESQLRVNASARNALSMIADGADGQANGTDSTTVAHGVRRRAGPLAINLADGEVLQFTSNGLTVAGDRISPLTITCVAAGDPLPSCASAGSTLTLDGSIAAQPRFQDQARSVFDKTLETELFVRDPYAAARRQGRVERYGTIHTYNAREGEGAPNLATDPIGTDP